MLFGVLLFLIPSQLSLHFWPEYAFIFGVRVDYLAPAVYLTDLLVILLVAVSRTKIKSYYILAVCLFALFNVYFSISPWVSFWKWLKIFELAFLVKYVSDSGQFFKQKVFVKIFSLSLIAVSLIGIAQFLIGRTVGWPLWFLGERSFTLSTPGIALQDLFGRQFLRAYSVFSHPNSLAGYLAVSVLLLFQSPTLPIFKKIKLFWPAIVFSSVAFLLTFSLSAFAGIAVVLTFRLLGRLKNSFVLWWGIDFGSREVGERVELAKISGEIVSKNFLTGTGLNTFVYFNRMMQPVHNIFLLVLSEAGILGLAGLSFVFYKVFKALPLIALFILTTGFFDHYWLTLQQNMLLFSVVAGLSFGSKPLD
ncbi:MAG: hypothetical protein UX13_C0025G0004 [Candidatus Woesebacteria bacterium GW2011_GWB1_45_5]|uniref:O-antigen polymerase n=1 Tax=Candidatus Woesebacteria bacterium GW2011_GWB1_45_5 TaxID=1618581 RepID=A0A0G1MP37_9BACT|nr:MAG: hypothetical protein UX13_C0025G0004 [Candidatus Woesebacteria bacterium GW2011_GWB1_45_5]